MTEFSTHMLRMVADKLEALWWKNITLSNYVLEFDSSTIIKQNYFISLCTICMDRLDDLKATLPVNLERTSDYDNLEFFILDYGSKVDKIKEWLMDEFRPMIESKRICYHRVDRIQFFSMSRSRNLAFQNAKGDIVFNIDADNFVQTGFGIILAKAANQAASEDYLFMKSFRNIHGQIGAFKSNFFKNLGGYDETFIGYGHEEKDVICRAVGLGLKIIRLGGGDSYRIKTGSRKKTQNFDPKGIESNWRLTEQWNKILSYTNLLSKNFKANKTT